MPPLFFRVENMTKDLCLRLEELAEKYETADFVKEDPSQFLRWYTQVRDVEVAAFTAAMLSFGNRKQFIPKIRLAGWHSGFVLVILKILFLAQMEMMKKSFIVFIRILI